MKIVHLASNHYSGSPLRIVRALNCHTACEATLITDNQVVDKFRRFDLGLDWECDKEQAVEAIEKADVIHFHGFLSVDRFDIRKYLNGRARIIRHYHGPRCVEPEDNVSVGSVSNMQVADRYFPKARLLPNIVNFEEKVSRPFLSGQPMRIFFSPTSPHSSWSIPRGFDRWVTKGRDEVVSIMRRIERRERLGFSRRHLEIDFLENRTFEECMRIKRASSMVVDDTVTGSYHLVGLEALAMGIPTLGCIDRRSERLLKDLTGAESIPWINVNVEALEAVLEVLISEPHLLESIGDASFAWMRKYYREDVLVHHFVKAYEDIIEDPKAFSLNRFDLQKKKDYWDVMGFGDTHYASRKNKTQRGARSLCASGYMDDRGGGRRHCMLESHVQIVGNDYPFGTWLFENRYRRVDADSQLFHEGKCQDVLMKYKLALPCAHGVRVADLGSGTGFGARLLKEEGQAESVIGIDKDMLAVAYAQEMHAAEGVCYLERDALCSGLEEASYGLVVAIDILEWVDCDASFVQACIRLMSKEGVCVISVGDFWNKQSEAYCQRRYSARSISLLLGDWFGAVDLYRKTSDAKSETSTFVKERHFSPLKEGESLIAVCSR